MIKINCICVISFENNLPGKSVNALMAAAAGFPCCKAFALSKANNISKELLVEPDFSEGEFSDPDPGKSEGID